MKTEQQPSLQQPSFVVCVDNTEYPAALERRKIYEALPDEQAEQYSLVRVIDESGEDYLYPAGHFLPVALPLPVQQALALPLVRPDAPVPSRTRPGGDHPVDDIEEDKDDLDAYRATVERVLTEWAEFLSTDEDIVCETIFDRAGDHYLLVEVGWENGYRVYGPLLHIDIRGGKLWIQNDGTEEGVAVDLVAANVPKDRIVLGFRHPSLREPAGLAVS